jgi:membrane protease YdiL (CAAX protease family)
MFITFRMQGVAEVAALVTLIASYIWVWQGSFTGDKGALIAVYLGVGLFGHARRRESARELGLRLFNFVPALRNASVVVLPAIGVVLVVGAAMRSWHFESLLDSVSDAPFLAAWGVVQQYGLLCILYRRLAQAFESPIAGTAAASLIFAAFHLPNGFLTGITLMAGIASCTLYRREPNVWALGIAHAAISFILLYALPESVTHGLRVGPSYG